MVLMHCSQFAKLRLSGLCRRVLFCNQFPFLQKKFFSKNFLTCVKCLTRTNCAEEKSLKLYQQKSRWRLLNNGLKFFYSRDSRNIFLALFVLFAHQSQKLHVSWSSPLWKKTHIHSGHTLSQISWDSLLGQKSRVVLVVLISHLSPRSVLCFGAYSVTGQLILGIFIPKLFLNT